MSASQLALAVASNNISNASNPSYTRQRLITAPAGPDGTAHPTGLGVDILNVQALRDNLIETRLRQETAGKSGEDALTKMLGDVQVLFSDNDTTGLLQKMTNFFNSFQTLSLDPASITYRDQVKTTAQAFIEALHGRNADLKNIQTLAGQAVSRGVDQINTLTSQIATITDQIRHEETDHVANELRDRRVALIKELSGYIEVHELESGGDYQLYTKDNHLLVFNNTAQNLAPADVTPQMGDGALKANLEVRDVYIPKYLDALDQMTYEVVSQVNSIHAGGYGLDGGTNVNFFTPLSSAADASGLIELSSAVAGDTRKIAASELSTGNDNRVAIALGNLLHDAVFTGGSITDQYGTLVFNVGTDINNAQTRLDEHDAMLNQLENRRQSISGVSIDEESVQIMQFQRSFEASARLIRTVDELMQVTLGLGGGA
jgi:flagellar hook-associated protein 1 FlgK